MGFCVCNINNNINNNEKCFTINTNNEIDQIKMIIEPKIISRESLIKCTYEIKDFYKTQIINYRNKDTINKDIEEKVKIWNNNKKEKLIYKKKFDKLGLNTISFLIEEKLNNMSFMFFNCSSLKQIEFIYPKTEEAADMHSMFEGCIEVEYLDLSNFNGLNVSNMGFMFSKCHKLKEIKGINTFNTSKVTSMRGLFNECKEIKSLDLSNFNTSNVSDMEGMFNECHKLKKIIGINKFNTSKVKNMGIMFQLCQELEYLDLSYFNTSNVTNMEFMFNKCYKLKEIIGINKFNTSKVTKMNSMFQLCKEIEYLDLSNFNTSNVTNMEFMFSECHQLNQIIGINIFNTSNVTKMNSMF